MKPFNLYINEASGKKLDNIYLGYNLSEDINENKTGYLVWGFRYKTMAKI